MKYFSRQRLAKYWRFAKAVVHKSQRDDLVLLAAALAHFAMLTLIPLLLLASYVIGGIYSDEAAIQRASSMVSNLIPVSSEVILDVFQGIAHSRATLGGFGLVILVWLCCRIFTTLQRALDNIWNIEHHEKRPFYLQWLVALTTIVCLGFFAWVSLVVTSMVGSLHLQWPRALWGRELELPDLVRVASVLASMGLSILFMFLIYRLLPSARVHSRSAIVGAVVAGVLWEVAKHLFTAYVTGYAHVSRFYGAMAGIVVVMFWSYISCLVVLFGAEVVSCHAEWIAARPVVATVEPVPEPASGVVDLPVTAD